jgi:hypothetical protein
VRHYKFGVLGNVIAEAQTLTERSEIYVESAMIKKEIMNKGERIITEKRRLNIGIKINNLL